MKAATNLYIIKGFKSNILGLRKLKNHGLLTVVSTEAQLVPGRKKKLSSGDF